MTAWSSVVAPGVESLRELVAGDLDGVVVVDRRGVVVFANPAAVRMLRPEGVALVGGEFGHRLVGADLTEVEVPETGVVVELRVSRLRWEGAPAWRVRLRDVTARRREAERQALGTDLLGGAERIAGLGAWEFDIRTGRVTHTSGMERIVGRDLDDYLDDPDRMADAVVHPDDRAAWRAAIEAAMTGERALDIEHRVLRPDGEVRVVRAVAEPVPGTDGRPAKLRGIVRDVTDERRAERTGRETLRWLEAIADNSQAGIYVKDTDGHYLFCNSAVCRVTGRTRAELKTMTDLDLLPAEVAETIRANDRKVLTGGVPVTGEECLEFAQEGPSVWLSVKFPVFGEDGRPQAVGGISVDVTEQRRADEALRRSEERFRLLAERSRDVVFRVRMEPEPVVDYVSPAAEAVLGYPARELSGDLGAIMAAVHPENRAAWEVLLSSPDQGPVVIRQHRPDGSIVWLEVRLVAVRDGSGRVVAIEGNVRDITDRVSAEQERQRLSRQLEQMERLESLGQLAGGVAHDFNNLLAVIVGTAEFLAEDLGSADPRSADVQRIVHAAQRGAALTRQLLIFSRREPSRPEVLDLNEVVTRIEDMLRRTIGEDVEFVSRLSPRLAAVSMDRAKLEQVVLNLVVNARAAMPGGGRLTLETDGVAIPEPVVRPSSSAAGRVTVPAGDYVRLTVTDTGCGMPPEVVRRAFEPFFTTRGPGEGSGLGLATVHGIISDAGGHITLNSRPGAGTTVRIHLPVTRADRD